MQHDYFITIEDANDVLLDLLENIQNTTFLPTTDFHDAPGKIKSVFRYTKNNEYQIVVGTAPLHENAKGDYVRTQDFINSILSCFHEEQHLHQAEMFTQPNPNPTIRQMAHADLIRHTIPETYNVKDTYWDNMNEIDAELYGIEKTRNFFKEYYPHINVDSHLMQIIQEEDQWYADRKITHIEQAIDNLQTKKNNIYNKPIMLQIRYYNPGNYSKQLKEFAKNPNNRTAYIQAYDAHDGKASNQMLLDFIREEYPWKYKNYPCLEDEWDDRIRTSKKPFLARIRGLDRKDKRIAELESHFDKIMSAENTEKDDMQFGD